MVHHNGAGIAAPQIGVFKELFTLVLKESEYPEANEISETVLINPSNLYQKKRRWDRGLFIRSGNGGVVERFYEMNLKGF